LLTGKLTQDILENFFSLLRGIGGYNTHPGPVEAINRMRIILLGKDPEHIVYNPAVEFPARGLYEMEDGNPTVESSSGAVIEGEDTVEVKDGMEDEVKQSSASISGEMLEEEQEIFISKDITKEIETEQTPTDQDIKDYDEFLEARENSNDESDEDTNGNGSTNEVLHYISGFIANKLKSVHPNLVDYSQQISSKKWIKLKCRGNLVIPSRELFLTVTLLEKEFCTFHGKTIDMAREPIERLSKSMRLKNPSIPTDIINLFVKIRFFQRIRHLNVSKQGHHMIRNLKQKGQFMF